jgi:hypothetical protein
MFREKITSTKRYLLQSQPRTKVDPTCPRDVTPILKMQSTSSMSYPRTAPLPHRYLPKDGCPRTDPQSLHRCRRRPTLHPTKHPHGRPQHRPTFHSPRVRHHVHARLPKKNHTKIRNSKRVTTLQQWVTTFERRPISSTASDTEGETSVQAELKAEERKLWRRIAGATLAAKTKSKEERQRWRRIEEPSPSPEVEGRKRKR